MSTSTFTPRGRALDVGVARGCPAQKMAASDSKGFPVQRYHCAVGQYVDAAPTGAFGLVIQALGVKRLIHGAGRRALRLAGKQLCEKFSVATTTFKTWPMARRKSGYFIEEEQFRVVAAPHIALPILEFENATDPLPRYPTAASQRPVGGVKLAARDCPSTFRARKSK